MKYQIWLKTLMNHQKEKGFEETVHLDYLINLLNLRSIVRTQLCFFLYCIRVITHCKLPKYPKDFGGRQLFIQGRSNFFLLQNHCVHHTWDIRSIVFYCINIITCLIAYIPSEKINIVSDVKFVFIQQSSYNDFAHVMVCIGLDNENVTMYMMSLIFSCPTC